MTFSVAASHVIASDGLLFESSVGSRIAIFTPSMAETRFEIVSSQPSQVFHSAA